MKIVDFIVTPYAHEPNEPKTYRVESPHMHYNQLGGYYADNVPEDQLWEELDQISNRLWKDSEDIARFIMR